MNLNQDAIQQDVSSTESTEQQERYKSPRELAMEAMEASRRERIEEDLGEKIAPVEIPAEEPAEEAQPDMSADKQLEAQVSETVIDKPEGVKVKVKIDGEEQEVELSKVLSQFQKNSAADKRLEEASRLLREAKERAESSPPATASQVEQQVTEVADDELLGKAKTAVSKLFEGEEDTAAQVLVEMIKSVKGGSPAKGPELDVASITNAVTQQLAIDSAFAKIQTDYPDILADKDLDALATMKARAKEAEGLSRAEAMLAAASDVYALIGKKPSGRQETESARTTRDEKLAKKADIDKVPSANASVASSTQQEDTSPSAVIAQMASRRLGQTLPRMR